MKKIIFTVVITLLASLVMTERYRAYGDFQFSQEFFERSINQKFKINSKIENLRKESFGDFLTGDINRQYKITMLIIPLKNGWKPQPRKGFEKGVTLKWERITDHTGRWGHGVIAISSITKGSPHILIDVFTP